MNRRSLCKDATRGGDTDSEVNQAAQRRQLRQTILQIIHGGGGEWKSWQGINSVIYIIFCWDKKKASSQPKLEGDLYIQMFQNLIGVLWGGKITVEISLNFDMSVQ